MVRVMAVGLVVVMTLLAGPMAAAHAGGMGIGGNVAFQCYVISGISPGGTTDLIDQFGERTGLKIGVAKLVCTPVSSANFTGARNPNPPDACDPTNPTAPCADHLKCYDVRSAKAGNPSAVVTLDDFFFGPESPGPEELAPVGSAQLLCVGAHKTIVNP